MAKSKRHLSRRNKVKKNVQIVYSEKRKVFVKRYLSPKGKRLVNEGKLTVKEADEKYGKNKYRINENAKPIKQITH